VGGILNLAGIISLPLLGGGVRLLVPIFLVRRFHGYEVPYKYARKK
jgi:hypothetical protein